MKIRNKTGQFYTMILFAQVTLCHCTEKEKSGRATFSEKLVISEAMYITYKGNENELSVIKPSDLKKFDCYVSPMSGRLIGGPTGLKIREFSITGSKMLLTLSDSEAKILMEQKQLAPNSEQALLVSPVEAKFSRLATSCVERGTGFSSRSGNNLMLVYFDRPTTLSGYVVDDDGQDEIAAAVPKAGFYFLERYVAADKKVKFRLFTGLDKDVVWNLIRQF